MEFTMGQINLQASGKILFGVNEANRLGIEVGKLGKRVLLITEKSFEEGASKIRQILEGHGIGVIVFDEKPVRGSAFTIERCQMLVKGSYADSILVYGDMASIFLARAVACSAPDELHPDTLLANDRCDASSLPCFEVTAEFWNPLLFGSAFTVTDSRNGCSAFIQYRPHLHSLLLCDPVQSLALPERKRLPQFFDLLLHIFSGALSSRASFLSVEYCFAAFKRVWPRRYCINRSWDLENASAFMEAGVLASLAHRDMGASWVFLLSQAICGHFEVPRSIAAMIIAPFVLKFLSRTSSGEFSSFMESLQCFEDVPESPKDFIEAFRVLIGRYAMPSQLRNIGIPRDGLALAAETAGTMLASAGGGGITVDQMYEILENSW